MIFQGIIHQTKHWTQELLGYGFIVLYRPAKIMTDVDALTRRFGTLIAFYIIQDTLIHLLGVRQRSHVFDPAIFSSAPKPQKLPNRPPNVILLHVSIVSHCFKFKNYPLRLSSFVDKQSDLNWNVSTTKR